MNYEIKNATLALLEYCKSHDWAGYEPYDALNSTVVASLRLFRSRIARIAFTQALKRSPFNFRKLLGINTTHNPKALALFLSSFVKLSRIGIDGMDEYIEQMIGRLKGLRSDDSQYWCWGYSFPWQTRTVLVPRWAPNLVCTAFVANAFLDVYETDRNPQYLAVAVSASEYILNDLYWSDESGVGFGYPLPSVRNQVHNANLLGSALLCRTYSHCRDNRFLGPALSAARYSASQQHADGGWDYGETPAYRWIDNFHTGFNLGALRSIGRSLATSEFETHVKRGMTFYRSHFLLANGAVRYYHNRTYPIDSHAIAQAILTLIDLRDLDPGNIEMARTVFAWAMNNMWDRRGFFYYRVLRSYTIRTSYMRWTQAWMFLALATMLSESAGMNEAGPATSNIAAAI